MQCVAEYVEKKQEIDRIHRVIEELRKPPKYIP